MFTGTTGTTGIIGTTGTTETTIVVVGVCAVNGGVEGVLWEIDDEQGEAGVERNKNLTGVGTLLG